MASQQAAFGKGTNNCSTYQFHLPSTSTNLSRNTVNLSVPIRIPTSTDSSVALPLLSTPGINIPIQITSSNPIQTQKSHLSSQTSRSLLNIPLQVTNSRQAGNGNVVQLQMLGEKKIINVDVDKLNQHAQNTSARYVAAPPQKHDVHGKLPEPITTSSLQMSGSQVQLMTNASNKTIMNQPIQVRPQSGGIYFMKSAGIKTVSTMDTVVTSTVMPPTPIIVRKPNSSSANVQSISLLPKSSIAARNSSTLRCTPIAPKVTPQPLVIPKSKLAPNLVPVSAAGGKTQMPAYLNTIKKSASASSAANQESLLQAHPNQKIIITPYQNLPKKIMLPNKPTSYNFQFANGQTHDSANVAVLSQLSNIPPLQPINKGMPPSSVHNNPAPTLSYQPEAGFSTKPSNANTEPISEKEYTISIPETDVIDDTYTVSISEVNNKGNNTEKSYTIPMPDKVKSLICKSSNVVDSGAQHSDNVNVSNSVPAILRRSTDINDKKSTNSRRRLSGNVESDLTNKSESIKNKNLSEIMSRFNDNPNVSLLATNKKSSLFCDEELDVEMDSKIGKNCEEFPSPAPVASNTHVNKDRRKSRVSSDVHLVDIDKMSDKQMKSDMKRKDVMDYLTDDTPGLQWSNGVARLKGSSLQFNMNEFGVIDVITKENKYDSKKGKDKKAGSPDQLYCCSECGCHGMPSEFISPMFCSNSCQNEWLKHKRQVTQSKKKSKPKKVLMKNFDKLVPVQEIKESLEMDTLDSDLKANSDEYECKELTIVEDVPVLKNSWLTEDGFSWNKYLEYYKAKPAPEKYFKPFQVKRNCFKKGMKLEAIDPAHPSIITVVTVVDLQGHRIRLHFDGFHEDYDFWVNIDSCDIFPAGWCEKNKKTVRAPLGQNQSSFSWNLYLRQSKAIAAPKHLFAHVSETNCMNGFRVGMKLEAEDKKNSLTCVASVADVINNRILIHFDSWDDIYDFWVDPTSPYIHPIGWCDDHEISLTPPDSYEDPENFTWDDYLQKSKSVVVPSRSFKPRPPNEFKVGMKLEAVDKRVPFLIRVATVIDVLPYQIKIAFDGWPEELAYWVDDDSPDMHPVGWCYYTGHSLEPPMTEEEYEIVGECGTKGCRGFGNINGLKLNSHFTSSECPYRLPPRSPVQCDRLEGIRPPVEHSEPRSKEPRKTTSKLSEMKIVGRSERLADLKRETYGTIPERISPKRKREEDSKSRLSILDDDLSSESKRKRESPISRDVINSSIFNPGYMPNPNKVKPPFWGGDCLALREILQKESFKVDPRNWSVSDVQRFVEQVTKSKERMTNFAKQRIDGEAFLMLAQDDLVKELGLKLGPAMKIYNSIIHLRERILS